MGYKKFSDDSIYAILTVPTLYSLLKIHGGVALL